MTTIAIDKFGTIAADGLSCIGDIRHRTNFKKIVVREAIGDRPARIFTMAGTPAMRQALIEWYEGGADPKNVPPGGEQPSWTLIVIEAHRQVYIASQLPYPTEFLLPQAFGTGGQHIYGLLVADATARHAVEIACKIDIYSGGEIQVVNISEALGIQAVREAAE
jgi:hypothetical protein